MLQICILCRRHNGAQICRFLARRETDLFYALKKPEFKFLSGRFFCKFYKFAGKVFMQTYKIYSKEN